MTTPRRFSIAVVRAIVRLYPREFGDRYGVEIEQFFRDGARRRPPPESWRVASRQYAVQPAAISNAFDRSGVVRAGQWVRIADVGGHIVRLEVAP